MLFLVQSSKYEVQRGKYISTKFKGVSTNAKFILLFLVQSSKYKLQRGKYISTKFKGVSTNALLYYNYSML